MRQRLAARAREINKSVNDCVEEAVEQWIEVTEDDPRKGARLPGRTVVLLSPSRYFSGCRGGG
jgi:hypothetical protein